MRSWLLAFNPWSHLSSYSHNSNYNLRYNTSFELNLGKDQHHVIGINSNSNKNPKSNLIWVNMWIWCIFWIDIITTDIILCIADSIIYLYSYYYIKIIMELIPSWLTIHNPPSCPFALPPSSSILSVI